MHDLPTRSSCKNGGLALREPRLRAVVPRAHARRRPDAAQAPDRDVPARRRRRPQHGRAVRRARDYYRARPTIAIAQPGQRRRRASTSTASSACIRAWRRSSRSGIARELAIVHACGSHDTHALALRRAGLHGVRHAGREEHADGWLNRYLQATAHEQDATPVPRRRADAAAAALAARHGAGAGDRAASASSACAATCERDATSFEELYAAAADKVLQRHRPARRSTRCRCCKQTRSGAVSARPTAPRIRGRRSARRCRRSRGSSSPTSASRSRSPKARQWDHHVNEGGATGQIANRLDDFSRGIAALAQDLGDRMADTVIADHVGVRPGGGGERQPRHRSRPRQRDVRDRRQRARAARSTASGRASRRSSASKAATSRSPPTSATCSARSSCAISA